MDREGQEGCEQSLIVTQAYTAASKFIGIKRMARQIMQRKRGHDLGDCHDPDREPMNGQQKVKRQKMELLCPIEQSQVAQSQGRIEEIREERQGLSTQGSEPVE